MVKIQHFFMIYFSKMYHQEPIKKSAQIAQIAQIAQSEQSAQLEQLEKSAQSKQLEQLEKSEQRKQSPPSLEFALGVCGHYFPADAFCTVDGCYGGGCVSSEQIEEMISGGQLFNSKTETKQADSSRDPHVHHGSDRVYSSNIRQIRHGTGRVYSSNIQTVHSRQKSIQECIICLDECIDLHDGYPSDQFCSLICWNFSRNPSAPRPTSLPEGAYVDECICLKKFINRRSDSMAAIYCGWECYGNR
jgi:hypothetical protein